MPSRLLLAAVALLAAASVSTVTAQPGAGTIGDKNMKESDTIRTRSGELERVRRESLKPDRKAGPSPEDKFPQIKEDFERIQLVNGDVLQSAATDYAHMAEAAEEVRRRAARLGSNLFPPDHEKKPKAGHKEETDERDLKSLLSALDGAIDRFVHSPIFQNIKVVNPQDSAKARQELEEIIKLSARVEKEAARLKKAGGG